MTQCCGSKYIEFGSESRVLAQFGSGSRVMLSILKKKNLQIILENNNWKNISFFNYRFKKRMVAKELFSSWVSEWWIFVLKFTPFLLFYPIFTCVDPDPQSKWIRIQYGSGSTTLLWRMLYTWYDMMIKYKCTYKSYR